MYFDCDFFAGDDIYLVEKRIKKRGKRSLVKWIGFEKPTWELSDNIIELN